jgi:hypothetical protein
MTTMHHEPYCPKILHKVKTIYDNCLENSCTFSDFWTPFQQATILSTEEGKQQIITLFQQVIIARGILILHD